MAFALPLPFAAAVALDFEIISPTMISSSDSTPPSDAMAAAPVSVSRLRCSSFSALSSFHLSERLRVYARSSARKSIAPWASQSSSRAELGYSFPFLRWRQHKQCVTIPRTLAYEYNVRCSFGILHEGFDKVDEVHSTVAEVILPRYLQHTVGTAS